MEKSSRGASREYMSAQEHGASQRHATAEQRVKASYNAKMRVSPIQEEVRLPSQLNSAFASPATTEPATSSTESTGTVKGDPRFLGSTGALRTPSYPFPIMDTPHRLGSDLHKPFTSLSPTVTPAATSLSNPSLSRDVLAPANGSSAPGNPFPPTGSADSKQSLDYPGPSLNEAVLMLHSEPGLEPWWTSVVQLMRDHYSVNRLSLTVPADLADLQNVPWGQKATFNVAEEDDPLSVGYLQRSTAEPVSEGSPGTQSDWDEADRQVENTPVPQLGRPRPGLQSRHSFAGFDSKTYASPTPSFDRIARLAGPMRTASYMSAASQQSSNLSQAERVELRSDILRSHAARIQGQETKFYDMTFAGEREPRGRVLPVLQALDYEPEPLIDGAGVNKVLERAKLVVLSRDYGAPSRSSDDLSSGKRGDSKTRVGHVPPTGGRQAPGLSQSGSLAHEESRTTQPGGFGRRDDGRPNKPAAAAYEDFEQAPVSPWSQSPAPSPAMRNDPSENPFFVDANVDEESFNPSSVPSEGYSSGSQIEAIGTDKSCTIIHLPLVHPLLSRNMSTPSADMAATPRQFKSEALDHPYDLALSTSGGGGGLVGPTEQSRTPVAILSLQSPLVPYPPNLIESLTHLSPHLATSCSLAQHFTNVESQAASLLRRRWPVPNTPSYASTTNEAQQLEDLAELDVHHSMSPRDSLPSAHGSVTSPSDCSLGSPAESLLGTPGWDASASFSSERRSSAGTPGHSTGAEPVGNYFQPMMKSSIGGTGHGRAQAQSLAVDLRPVVDRAEQDRRRIRAVQGAPKQTQGRAAELPLRNVHYPGLGVDSGEMATHEVSESLRQSTQRELAGRGRSRAPTSDPRLAGQSGPSAEQAKGTVSTSKARRGPRHSLLHSYGADFSATFQSLPTAAAAITHKQPPGRSHAQSISESAPPLYEMPPPSARLMRTIIDAIPVQIFTAAPQTGAITWVNSKFLTYRGHSEQDFMKDPWQSIHPAQRDDYLKTWGRSLRNGEQFSYRVRLRRFDGVYRWFYVRAAPLRDTRGITVHWFGTNMDIHDQHIAEFNAARQQETAASESKYRALANSSPQIVFAATDVEGVIFANTQWMYYSGQGFEDALGMGFTDHVHPEDLAKCNIAEFAQNLGRTSNLRPSRNNSSSHLSSSSSMTSSDTSSKTDATVTQSPPQRPRTAPADSSKLKAVRADSPEKLDADHVKVSVDSDGRPCYSTEVRLRSKEGEYRWHLVRCTMVDAINFDNGEASWFGTCTDINDHKMLEQRMQDTMDSRTRFLSNMSHEIRTPLIGISGMVEFLYNTPLNSEQLDYCETIASSSAGLLDIVNDILDLSKIEAGMMSLSHDWFYIRSTIEAVNDALSSQVINKRLELNYIVEEDVPPIVKGDQARIRQVLMNILGNAVKFTPKGEIFAHCRVHKDPSVSLKDDEISISFEVVDSGPGFSKESSELMFKPFSQIDTSSTRQYGGTGLGLVISRQLVELHGGKMTGTSVPGKGSTFTFSAKFGIPSPADAPAEELSTDSEPDQDALQWPSRPFMSPLLRGSAQSPALAGTLTESPAGGSSASSDPSVRSYLTARSDRSSMSSVMTTVHSVAPTGTQDPSKMQFVLPKPGAEDAAPGSPARHQNTLARAQTDPATHPPIYSILVICPQPYSLQAITKHLEVGLPKSIPRQITSRRSTSECQELLGGENPVIFTHVLLNLAEPDEAVAVMEQIFHSPQHSQTSLVILADARMRNDIKAAALMRGFSPADRERRVRYLHKPVKPSRLVEAFDPGIETQRSTEHIRRNAEQQSDRRRQAFAEMGKTISEKGHRVLLVEDNPTNQKVWFDVSSLRLVIG